MPRDPSHCCLRRSSPVPFTVSHAAAVLPFAHYLRRWHMLSAAVIGSMVPDFGFFLPGHWQRAETHSLEALVQFCLPVGLGAYWLFELLVKPATSELLPDRAYVRAQVYSPAAHVGNATQWLLAGLGVILGAITHLVWDAFTHEGARGVRMFPALDDSFGIGGHTIYAYRVAQQAGSLFGLVIVAGIVAFAMREPAPPPACRRLSRSERRGWTILYGLVSLPVIFASYRSDMQDWPSRSISTIAEYLAIGSLRGAAASLILVSIPLLLRLRQRSS